MGTFVITFREGIEISLIIAILFGSLAQTGRRHHMAAAWRGIAASAAACIALGVLVFQLTGSLDERSEQLAEAVVMFVAAAVLTWMIVWMRANARSMKGSLTAGLAAASTATAVTVFAATAVAREGFETVMFLLSAEGQSSSAGAVLAGAVLGFGAAAVVGVAIYARGLRIDLQRFFRWTGVALILFAASSLAYGVHELREFMGVEGFLANELWRVDAEVLAKDHVVGGVLGMFGWMPHPELVRVVAFLAYAVPVLAWFLRPAVQAPRRDDSSRAPSEPSAATSRAAAATESTSEPNSPQSSTLSATIPPMREPAMP